MRWGTASCRSVIQAFSRAVERAEHSLSGRRCLHLPELRSLELYSRSPPLTYPPPPTYLFQGAINADGLLTLKSYIKAQQQLGLGHKDEWRAVQLLVARLDALDKSSDHKNIELLLLTEALARRVGAGRLTSCKSAKDRTSMAVTLEQVCAWGGEWACACAVSAIERA